LVERKEYIGYIGSLREFSPNRAIEGGRRIGLVLSQWELRVPRMALFKGSMGNLHRW
jgi:hypothetical protein